VTLETSYEGFLFDLIETLARRLNFKYELYWNEKTGLNRRSDAEADEEVDRMLQDKEVRFQLFQAYSRKISVRYSFLIVKNVVSVTKLNASGEKSNGPWPIFVIAEYFLFKKCVPCLALISHICPVSKNKDKYYIMIC